MKQILEQKHREGLPFSEGDRIALRETLKNEVDEASLESLIYIYGYHFSYDETVAKLCDRHIFFLPIPGLTAICLKVVCQFWSNETTWEKYGNALKKYIDADVFEIWYDESIFSFNFIVINGFFSDRDLKTQLVKFRNSVDDDGLRAIEL